MASPDTNKCQRANPRFERMLGLVEKIHKLSIVFPLRTTPGGQRLKNLSHSGCILRIQQNLLMLRILLLLGIQPLELVL